MLMICFLGKTGMVSILWWHLAPLLRSLAAAAFCASARAAWGGASTSVGGMVSGLPTLGSLKFATLKLKKYELSN